MYICEILSQLEMNMKNLSQRTIGHCRYDKRGNDSLEFSYCMIFLISCIFSFLTANKKIYNRDCRRIQLECGKNMKMISIWKNPTDHHDRFACIQYCTCINNEYIGRNGRCE